MSDATDALLNLEVTAGNAIGTLVTVGDRLVIGRSAQGVGALAGDAELSRHHARISRGPEGAYTIEDLASRHGTLVNGVRLTAPAALGVGDRIEVGATTLIVRSVGPPPAAGAARTAAVDVRIEIDVEHATARISLDGAPVPLRFEGGAWRWAPASPAAE